MRKLIIVAMLMMSGCATSPQWEHTDAYQFDSDRAACRESGNIMFYSPRTVARTRCSDTMGCTTTFTTINYRRTYSDDVFQACMRDRGYTISH